MTLRIRGFHVKRVLIYKGSESNIMYLDLYKGLSLRDENLTKYDTLLVGFDEKMAMLAG